MFLQINVPFRGNRKYLHSTDIYRAFIDHLERNYKIENIIFFRIKFNNFSNSILNFYYWEEGTLAHEVDAVKGYFWLKFKDGKRIKGFFSDSNQPVYRRIEGNEPEIMTATEVESNCATVAPIKEADSIEHVVFATKKIHNLMLPLQEGLWIVGELRLNKILQRELLNNVKVKLENNYAEKITESSINIGGENLGNIIFMVANYPN